ncbi:MAG: hypothetical protein ACOH1V_11410 [Stenotrophomonas sp.]
MSSLRLTPAFVLLLAACSGPADVGVNATTSETPAAAAPAVASAPLSPPQQEEKGMHKECPGSRLDLTVLPAKDDEAIQTRLEIEKDGQRQAIEKPAEMSGYTAVGLGCTQDRQGTPYFVVQYGELPFGCGFCEWFYLYDADGKQLTHSKPPLREEDGQQAPNNDEYEQLITRLGIAHPEVDYVNH